MKKIPSLFKRDYEGTRQVYDEAVEGSEWVLNGEGVATLKFDGTCCMVRDGKLYKRYDRKLTKAAKKRQIKEAYTAGESAWEFTDFKPAPPEWEAAEEFPDPVTGHWPGWVPVSETNPEDQYHREAFMSNEDGTYELVGPKVQGNQYDLKHHYLLKHGIQHFDDNPDDIPPRTFERLRQWLGDHDIEGIVWHHPDGRMVKIKRKDFGYPWP